MFLMNKAHTPVWTPILTSKHRKLNLDEVSNMSAVSTAYSSHDAPCVELQLTVNVV